MTSLHTTRMTHLSDQLIGHVLPHSSINNIPLVQTNLTISHTSLRDIPTTILHERPPLVHGFQAATATSDVIPSSTIQKPRTPVFNPNKDTAGVLSLGTYQSLARRQQCRTNQARYRFRQRERQLKLEEGVEELQQEVGNLKRKHRDLSSRERSNHSPWTIVAEFFRLIEYSFHLPWAVDEMMDQKETRQILAVLKSSFAHDIAIGDLSGAPALMEQLRCYSLCFTKPQLKVERIEIVVPHVMAAKASLHVTISDATLKNIFPHLPALGDKKACNQLRFLYDRLLGQRLEIDCTITFLFDEDTCRVVRLEISINFVAALSRILDNLEDVSAVLEHAAFTPEFCIVL